MLALAGSVGAFEDKRRGVGNRGRCEDDEEEVWTFCDSWITAGYVSSPRPVPAGGADRRTLSYLAHLGLLFGTTAIFATLLVIISNSRQKRHDGWKLVGSLMALHAASLIVTFSLVVHEFGHDNRFYLGCKLGTFVFFLLFRKQLRGWGGAQSEGGLCLRAMTES